jgi:hypothetical protein
MVADGRDLFGVQSELSEARDANDAEQQQVIDIDEVTQRGDDHRKVEQGA